MTVSRSNMPCQSSEKSKFDFLFFEPLLDESSFGPLASGDGDEKLYRCAHTEEGGKEWERKGAVGTVVQAAVGKLSELVRIVLTPPGSEEEGG